MGIVRNGLIGSLAFLVACSGTQAPVALPTSAETTTRPAATQAPEPTAVAPAPEPTAAAATGEATPAPEPSATLESDELTTGPQQDSRTIVEPEDESTASLPAFVEPPVELTNLVGTEYEGRLEALDYQPDGLVGGGSVINVEAESADTGGIAWRVENDRVRMGISSLRGRTEEGKARWQLESVWLLQLAPASSIAFGNIVCKADEPTHAYGEELFFAVTNNEQDTALGAWIITTTGPVEYEAFTDLQCERFFP